MSPQPGAYGLWPVVILNTAWDALYKAQRERRLATTGPYAFLRHPQYGAFILILAGFLLQWPTLPTLLMFPVLTAMYVSLAVTPGFLPRRWPAPVEQRQQG